MFHVKHNHSPRDTIYALASGSGRAGVAVVRISGPQAKDAARALLSFDPITEGPRIARLARLCHPNDGREIDHALAIGFAAPASFTGEDVLELHVHGGPAVVAATLAACAAAGLRAARAGEFTRRAFDNGKLDLSQVEGLADLIDAETESQRRAALSQMDGALGRECARWRADILRALALYEASIDFSDEDLPPSVTHEAARLITTTQASIAQALSGAAATERLRGGYICAILGAPNAGKSSLVNALARRDVAIASPLAGTTRDCIEVALDIGGFPVTLIDTAGLRESGDVIEQEGVRRALAAAERADFRILVASYDAPLPTDIAPREEDILVWNKSDIASGEGVAISAATAAGLDGLIACIRDRLGRMAPAEGALTVRRRHADALTCAQAHLVASLKTDDTALIAEELRGAMREIGAVTGAASVDDMLDVIFRSFCIGK